MSKFNLTFLDDEITRIRYWYLRKGPILIEFTTDEIRELFKELELHEAFEWKCPF